MEGVKNVRLGGLEVTVEGGVGMFQPASPSLGEMCVCACTRL